MKRLIPSLVLTAAVALPAVGHAAPVLYSMHPNFFPELLRVDCLAQNFNSSTQTATVDALDILGAVVATSGPVAVPPGGAGGIAVSGSIHPSTACRYTLTGSAKKWRAVGIVTTEGSPHTLRDLVEAK